MAAAVEILGSRDSNQRRRTHVRDKGPGGVSLEPGVAVGLRAKLGTAQWVWQKQTWDQ